MPNIVSNAELLVAVLKTSSITAEHQALITLFHDLVENAVRGILKYDPTYGTHVEYYPVQRRRQQTDRLQLRHLPVRRVTEVIVDTLAYGGQAPGAFTADNGAETLTAGVDYFLQSTVAGIGGSLGLHASDGYSKSGILQRVSDYWPCPPCTVKVTYVAGYTDNELRGQGTYHTAGEIKKATLDTLTASYRELVAAATSIANNRAGNVISENLGDYGYTLDDASAALSSFSVVVPASAHMLLQNHVNFGVLGM